MPRFRRCSLPRTAGLAAIYFAVWIALGSRLPAARASVFAERATPRAALWQRLYDGFPEVWKTRMSIAVREVDDEEMDRLVREHGDEPVREAENDEVDAFYEWSAERRGPEITIRRSLSDREAEFVFTHEYGHFVWEEKLSERQRGDYFRIWSQQRRARRLVTDYAADCVDEGFAEVFAHFLRKPDRLHRRDPLSESFVARVLDEARARRERMSDSPDSRNSRDSDDSR